MCSLYEKRAITFMRASALGDPDSRGGLKYGRCGTGINEAATEALANAMYRYTFGIVGVGGSGSQSLGTGVGVFWKGTYATRSLRPIAVICAWTTTMSGSSP
jgi:hypothetical protein